MPTKSWKKKVEATKRSQAGRGGWVNGAVLVVLIVAVMVVTAKVMVPPGRWENLWRDLPARWEALRALLHGEGPGRRDPVPLGSPTPLSTTPVVTPSSDGL